VDILDDVEQAHPVFVCFGPELAEMKQHTVVVEKPYNTIMKYIHYRISFLLIRSTVLYLRGTSSSPPSSNWDHLKASSDLALTHHKL
jgi:hypothetical protein